MPAGRNRVYVSKEDWYKPERVVGPGELENTGPGSAQVDCCCHMGMQAYTSRASKYPKLEVRIF